MVGSVRDRLKFLFSKSAYFFESAEYTRSHAPFPEILIDMSCYHNDELVQESLHLLNRFFTAETSLFHSAVQTQLLLTQQSKEVGVEQLYSATKSYMTALDHLCVFWISKCSVPFGV